MSNHRPNKWLSLIAWLLPSCGLKRWVLRRLGNHVGYGVTVGPTLVLNCGRFSLGDGVSIMNFNVFKTLSSIELGPNAFIGNFNQFTAASEYQQHSPFVGQLLMGESAGIMNRHYFDCAGQVILRPFAAALGIKSVFQSHELDLADNTTTPGRIILDKNAMTGTACVLLMDSYLPERSVLAAGSLLTRAKPGDKMPVSSLYAGVPARYIREVRDFAWWHRDTRQMASVTPFDEKKFLLE
jgi:acetyltransferase-like isoleucine patch superfamily enzyme